MSAVARAAVRCGRCSRRAKLEAQPFPSAARPVPELLVVAAAGGRGGAAAGQAARGRRGASAA